MSAIVLDDLRFAYPPLIPGQAPQVVLRGVSLTIPRGQAVALVGPTDSGKTTLALILAGLAPEMTGGELRGSVYVNGLDVRQTPAAQVSTHLGLVFQEPERQLFNMTVASEVAFGLEGLGLPPAEIGRRVTWALEQTGLTGLEERAPWQLSGGQQKRLAIATILAMRPPILVLDEPMAGLDPQGRREMAAVLTWLKRSAGTTILVIEKDNEFVARWAERVLILADGRIVRDGPPSQVFREAEALRRWGIALPQVAELAARLRAVGESADFLTAQQAMACLAQRQRLATAYTAAGGSVTTVGPANGPDDSVATPRAADTAAAARPPAVDLQEVCFTYPGGTRALTAVSLTVRQGEFVALVGPNGSGKSTLARHLNGLLRPQTGSVFILGRPTSRQSVGELARQVGYVFQNPDHQIFAPTVREEVAFGLRNQGLRGEELAERVAATLAAFGLTAWADAPPAVLGYGLRRLITVAAVWAMRPPIWVLDEPTTGLDARYTAQLLDKLRALHCSGHTILLITHDLRLVAEAAQRVVVLHDGQVVMDGPTEQVLSDAANLARYGLRPPPITRLSALLARDGFPHPMLTVDQFVTAWSNLQAEMC